MDNTVPVQKNQDLELTIEGMTSEGQGVARVNGYTVFVPLALEGERVRAHIIKVTSSWAIAKLIEIITPSRDRVKPPCPIHGSCGGCTLQHLSYPAQLECKRKTVLDALKRIGGFNDIAVPTPLAMDEPWHYRNKGGFPIGTINDTVCFGFYAQRSHRLIPIATCPILDERINRVAQSFADWANENHISVYNEATGKGMLRHLVVRVTDGGIMATVVTATRLTHIDSLIAALSNVDSLYHNLNPRATNVIFSNDFRLLKGKAVLDYHLDGMSVLVSPQSFLQVNSTQTKVLYSKAIELLNPQPNEAVIDVYCGIGTISLMLAKRAKSVIGIESVKSAIEDAINNAKSNAITNAEFICGNAEKVLPVLIEQGLRPDAIVIDPPRKGCDRAVLEAIAASGVQRMVYVSCNPATLARDLAILATLKLYPTAIQPVDMFPHTAHVETIVLLQKKNS